MKRFSYLLILLGLILLQPSCSVFKSLGISKAQDTLTTASGLKYIIRQEGKGELPKPEALLKVHYTGKLLNDTVFDSSYERKRPFTFVLGKGKVIKGWDEGFALLKQGTKATFIIPPNLAYGGRATGKIPANSTLVFDVELMEVKNPIVIEPYDVKGKDTITTASGLKYIVVKKMPSSEKTAKAGELVTVDYSGYFKDGKMFDSSVKRGTPIKFTLGQGQVIKGWDEALQLMRSGEKYRLIIPYQLAYGERGRGGIPPRTDLIFDVEMVYHQPEIKVEPYNTKGLDTITTKSGLKIIKVETTSNASPNPGDRIAVHYTGYLPSGKIFDSSVKRGTPIEFSVGKHQVIKGWDEALLMMHEGDKCRLIVPPHLAYGERGAGSLIPPNTTLIFDVNLVEIK